MTIAPAVARTIQIVPTVRDQKWSENEKAPRKADQILVPTVKMKFTILSVKTPSHKITVCWRTFDKLLKT